MALASTACTITFEVRMAWWWELYCRSVIAFALMTGLSPDLDKMREALLSAVLIRRRGGRWKRLFPKEEA